MQSSKFQQLPSPTIISIREFCVWNFKTDNDTGILMLKVIAVAVNKTWPILFLFFFSCLFCSAFVRMDFSVTAFPILLYSDSHVLTITLPTYSRQGGCFFFLSRMSNSLIAYGPTCLAEAVSNVTVLTQKWSKWTMEISKLKQEWKTPPKVYMWMWSDWMCTRLFVCLLSFFFFGVCSFLARKRVKLFKLLLSEAPRAFTQTRIDASFALH